MPARAFPSHWARVVLLVTAASCATGLRAQSVPVAPARSGFAFANVSVVDVRTGEVRPRFTVVVTGNRITAAGPASSVRVPARTPVIDATGKYVIPGLTDTHFHFASEWSIPPLDTSAYFAWILAGGVTSVREMSVDGYERAIDARAEASAGRLLGPRIYVSAGPNPRSPDPYRSRQAGEGDAEMRAAIAGAEAAEARFIKRFYGAGGMVLAGTDEVPFPPFGVSEEMRLLVAAGLPPLAALQAATINAARAMRWDRRLGTIEVGKLADLVLLDANPLEDITNVRRIHAVVADGRLFDRAALDTFLARVGTPMPPTSQGTPAP